MHQLQSILDTYFNAWNKAFQTKNEEEIKSLMSTKFLGFWSYSGLDIPEQYDYHYDIKGVLSQYKDAHKSFEIESSTLRRNGEEYLVIGTETNVVDGTPHPAKCMFVWRKENNEWKLVREYIELEK